MNAGISMAALLPGFEDTAGLDKEKQKVTGAAKDFEALLIGQLLRSAREEDSGWLGTGDDDASATAFGLGEEQLAKAMAAGGGLGLQKLIASGLAARTAATEESGTP